MIVDDCCRKMKTTVSEKEEEEEVTNKCEKETSKKRQRNVPSHNCSMVTDRLVSQIRWYFCFLVLARNPCHGRLPRLKYINT